MINHLLSNLYVQSTIVSFAANMLNSYVNSTPPPQQPNVTIQNPLGFIAQAVHGGIQGATNAATAAIVQRIFRNSSMINQAQEPGTAPLMFVMMVPPNLMEN
jgi:hypothetical protein